MSQYGVNTEDLRATATKFRGAVTTINDLVNGLIRQADLDLGTWSGAARGLFDGDVTQWTTLSTQVTTLLNDMATNLDASASAYENAETTSTGAQGGGR